MTERRYTDAEMAEIFDRATREGAAPAEGPEARALMRADGFTLSELQEIGREAGIAPEAVARSAAALELRSEEAEAVRRVVGAPLGVSRSVSLPRRVTEDEWHRIVAALRDTFDANGRVRESGEFREWRNGNLSVALEPEGQGTRLRMRTRKGGGEALPIAGVGLFGISAFAAVYGVLQGAPVMSSLSEALSLLLLGGGLWTAGYLSLKGWARRRLAQFRETGARIAGIAAEPARLEEGRRSGQGGG
ncbi:MAG: hypothetical protein JSU98_02850 [Gemmatimonadales bacterium]|jgi:hypothetical protein|nr:MAG: hypothetical protein JSU98_02850 [Gemmatimonadales bacterium]